jgi:hypothetical protein
MELKVREVRDVREIENISMFQRMTGRRIERRSTNAFEKS